MAIEWNYETMTTGWPEIDEEHKEWLRQFNTFDDAVVRRQGAAAIHDALRFFSSYSEMHFPHEERVMEQYKCPSAALNRAEHQRFREMLQEIEGWIGSDGASMVEVIGLKSDMERWLANHICEVDTQLRTVVGPDASPPGSAGG